MPETSTGQAETAPSPQRRADAAMLLDFAGEEGVTIAENVVWALRQGEGAAFEEAYASISRRMRPVTAATLRATASVPYRSRWMALILGESEAETWSRFLWMLTATVIAFILWCGYQLSSAILPPIDAAPDREVFQEQSNYARLAQFALPFLFGALGACAYLLRRCHRFIYTRTFDPRRKPEYVNRIFLGLVSGGAGGLLFAGNVLGGSDITRDLSASAVGFLCGYNNDFLFVAIERLAAALLPKVPPQGPPEAPGSPPSDEPETNRKPKLVEQTPNEKKY